MEATAKTPWGGYDPIWSDMQVPKLSSHRWWSVKCSILWIFCECSVHLCWVNNIWWRNTLTLIPSQPFHSSRTAAETNTCTTPCLMPAWCGLMSSSSWLQLFITFPLAAACLTDIQLPGHRWSTKANSLAKGIITYAKNAKKHIEKESFGSCQFTTTGVLDDDDHEADWSSIFQSFCQIVHRMEGTWRSKCVSF